MIRRRAVLRERLLTAAALGFTFIALAPLLWMALGKLGRYWLLAEGTALF